VEITNSNNEEACAQVLIESSNKGGELVSAIWTVTLVYKDQLKYDKVEKNWWITGQAKTSPTTYTGDD
jgi:hypothetical protein